MSNYNYEWKTIDDILKNKNTLVTFRGYSETSLNEMTEGATDNDYKVAHKIWLKLKDLFNTEAKFYNDKNYQSKLGSVGPLKEREVLRSMWWDLIEGDTLGYYGILTTIIEMLHDGEQLESGTIYFGS